MQYDENKVIRILQIKYLVFTALFYNKYLVVTRRLAVNTATTATGYTICLLSGIERLKVK